MRIAISGSHHTGKTTLVEALQNALPSYHTIEEPYNLLVEEGHDFADFSAREDFELQLNRSLQSILENDGEDLIFDRCPADLMAYLLAQFKYDRNEYEYWMSLVSNGMSGLDLVIYVPVEHPDRMRFTAIDYPELRLQVDEALQGILFDHQWENDLPVIEVTGTVQERCSQILSRIAVFERE